MKNIIYIGGFELPDKNAAAIRVVNNAKVLKLLNYEVVFVDVDRNINKPILETASCCNGFKRYSMCYTNKRLISIKDFIQVISCIDNVTHVIAYNYPAIALFKLKNYCKKNKIKLISDCTEWYETQSMNFVKKCIKELDIYFRMKVIQPRLDGIIVISKYLEDYYKKKIHTVRIPPLTDYEMRPAFVADSKKMEKDKVLLVYAGSPGKNKDKLNKIIESLAGLNDVTFKFDVMGITKEQFLTYYPEDSKHLEQLNDKVKFWGCLPHKEALTKMLQSDFSLFYREITRTTMAGFPTKFAESISLGIPVITNQTSDLGEYLIDGINGFFIKDDMEKTFKYIFSRELGTLKSMKKNVNPYLFDYRNYVNTMDNIL